jgi:hypothetical protein
MKKVEVIEGVAAMYNGKFWGFEHNYGDSPSKGFVDFDNAEISDPRYCKEPTDMTWNPANTNRYNPEYGMLKKATLVNVRKTVTTEFEVL